MLKISNLFWDEFFQEKLGNLVPLEHGGRGFKEIYNSATGAKIYTKPVSSSPKGDYFHVEITGDGAACLTPFEFQSILYVAKGGVDIAFKRIDLAFDELSFTPSQFYDALITDDIKCRASRSSIEFIDSPFQTRENNEIGCQTAYIGSKNSERRIRVYNEHGFTRLEFQLRDDWAHVIASTLLNANYSEWLKMGISFVRQFIEVERDWWDEFIERTEMADIIVKSARVISLNKLKKWMGKQVVPAIFALQAVMGIDGFQAFIVHNLNDKRLEKWRPIIELGFEGGK